MSKSYIALRLAQPIGDMYLTAIPARDLVNRVQNRPRTSTNGTSEDIQRVFSTKRIGQIADFTEDPDATFPTPIILAADSSVVQAVSISLAMERGLAGGDLSSEQIRTQAASAFSSSSAYLITLPDSGIFADVLDGQHRLLGLQRSRNLEKFELPVVIMFDLDPGDKAYVFSIINSKQTPVPSSLIYDLFDLSNARSPRKTCHEIAQVLNRDENSPFYKRLKMLGRKEEHHGQDVMLSQGTFAARLVELLSSDPDRDARMEKADSQQLSEEPGRPLRKYYLRKDDDSITKILLNYFNAVRRTFPREWDDSAGNYIIRKSVGYTALIKVLREILPIAQAEKKLTEDAFFDKFQVFKNNLGLRQLTGKEFPGSDAKATELAEILIGKRSA
ncbi:MAG: DGQHR domain-containing protein [Propionivibrio sp.]|nr:DGQHR domain-containing protein [Propionivibrio sp.]